MAGGLLNLVSQGQQNIMLNGNPSKTFWKSTYKKYTNFGKQNFRLDYEGTPTLSLTHESTYTFKVKRYADLLMDCYLSFDLPNIWSPIFPPREVIDNNNVEYTDWVPYEFKWIESIGALLINKITITCGNQKLQEFSGQYLLSAVQRDFSAQKLKLFNEMIGNIPELNDPGNSGSYVNTYPNAYYTTNAAGAQPSINGRTLYIPLNAWFCLKSQMAFPLVSLQYNELVITITLKPIKDLFQIRDVFDNINGYPYIAPNFNEYSQQMHRFLQTPPDVSININSYIDKRSSWNANIHLNCTYCFLSNDESTLFAKNRQSYLIKQVYEKNFYNLSGANKVDLESLGMVSSWMFFLRRSDANLRNEWTNYTNWPYNYLPYQVELASVLGTFPNPNKLAGPVNIGPGVSPYDTLTGLQVTGVYNPQNHKNILTTMAILLDGDYRENTLPSGIFNFVEKYVRTSGYAPNGLYCYNFCLDTSPFNLQPSGAMNMSRFTNIQFELTTIIPPIDPYAQTLNICDDESGDIIGINKPTWRIFEYNYDLYVYEERINIVVFVGGNAGLMYAT
jgi:hypothetical protein